MLDRRHRRRAGAGLWTRCLIVLSALLAASTSLAPFAATAQTAPPAVAPSPAPVGPSPLLADDDPPPRGPKTGPWTGGGRNIGGRMCWFGSDGRLVGSSPSGEPEPCRVGINNNLRVFADENLEPDKISELRIVRPDGSTMEQANGEDGDPIWWLAPGSPTGQYLLTASVNGREVQSDFTVVLRETWHDPVPIVRIWPGVGRPGTAFRIEMAGFEPGQAVDLYLYQGTPFRNALFRTVLETVRANERGEATTSLASRPGDPEDVFTIVSDPPSRGSSLGAASFGVSATRTYDELEARWTRLWSTAEDRQRHERRAQAIVYDANRLFASVVAKNGRGIEYLRCVYVGPWLETVTTSVQEMQARGEYRVASMPTRPIVQELALGSGPDISEADFEVTVLESWDDRLFDASGQLLRVNPSPARWRYKVHYGIPSQDEVQSGGKPQSGLPGPDCGTSYWFIWDGTPQ
jgi:hypothetical protein